MQYSQFNEQKHFCCHMMYSALLPPSGWGNENDMRMVDVNYGEYALIYTIKTKDGAETVVNKLYGKAFCAGPMNLNVNVSTAMHTAAD